jgi:hypothetical protein
MTAFLAQDLSEGDSDPEPYELIEKRFYDWDEALKMIASGRIKDSKTIATLLFVDRFGDG